MNGSEHARYRLNLARGFLAEGEQDVQLARWRSVVDNAKLAVENAAKAVLALVMPVGRTHNPAPCYVNPLTQSCSPMTLCLSC